MTRKDYYRIARAIGKARGHLPQYADEDREDSFLESLLEAFSLELSADNPRFDRARFSAEVERVAAETRDEIFTEELLEEVGA